jgi:hypothetical protein
VNIESVCSSYLRTRSLLGQAKGSSSHETLTVSLPWRSLWDHSSFPVGPIQNCEIRRTPKEKHIIHWS